MGALTLLALLAAPAGAAVVAAGATCPGQDWSLSESVKPQPRTGLFTMGAASRHAIVAHRGHTLTWAELNPAEGIYDWSRLDQLLRRAEEREYGVVLRLKSSVTDRRSPWGELSAVPDWVLERYDPPRGRTRDNGDDDYIEVVVPWAPGVQEAYLRFVHAFGEQRFHRHRRLLGLYVHGISSSFGEELWLNEAAVEALRPRGLTPERLERTFRERLKAWAEAFGPDVGRLAWVGAGWIAAGDEWRRYRDAADRLDRLATELGLGHRWGHSEAYNGRLDENGQVLEASGRLRTDAEDPLLRSGRYWGGENEVWRGEASEAFDHRRAVVRALQMQMRLLWVNDAGVALDPEINRYFTQVAGRGANSSPDAWALLRETEVRVGSEKRRVGNLERWLYQVREAGDATARARPVRRAPQSKDWGEPIEWSARSTQRKRGRPRMTFALAPAFRGGESTIDAEIQVSWIDNGARWHLEIPGEQGWESAAPVVGVADDVEKTTSFSVEALPVGAGAADIALVADRGDLVVSRLRLVRRSAVPAGAGRCGSGE